MATKTSTLIAALVVVGALSAVGGWLLMLAIGIVSTFTGFGTLGFFPSWVLWVIISTLQGMLTANIETS